VLKLYLRQSGGDPIQQMSFLVVLVPIPDPQVEDAFGSTGLIDDQAMQFQYFVELEIPH
jgi:hypothetical protein